MKIAGKDCGQIVITKDEEVLAVISDTEIIEKEGVSVELSVPKPPLLDVPTCDLVEELRGREGVTTSTIAGR